MWPDTGPGYATECWLGRCSTKWTPQESVLVPEFISQVRPTCLGPGGISPKSQLTKKFRGGLVLDGLSKEEEEEEGNYLEGLSWLGEL